MGIHMKFSNLFITGADYRTEWMLPWFIDNYYQHNETPLRIIDFGLSEEMRTRFLDQTYVDFASPASHWFKKPSAMIEATKYADNVCWLDSDCEVRGDISDIFSHIQPNKLSMVEDQPWSTRRGETWHNSGVVAFKNVPVVLRHWSQEATMMMEDRGPMYGDQDILHELVRPGINRMIHIHSMPKKYNTLRLDLLDNTAPAEIKIMHWTGKKGKEEIRNQMNE